MIPISQKYKKQKDITTYNKILWLKFSTFFQNDIMSLLQLLMHLPGFSLHL